MRTTLTRIALAALGLGLFAAPAQAAFVPKPAPAPVETTAPAAAPVLDDAAKTAAAETWKSMSRAERKATIKNLKKALRSKGTADETRTTNLILLTLITIFIPFIGPFIAMLIHEGTFNSRVLLSLILGLLGHIPGVIYNLIIFFG